MTRYALPICAALALLWSPTPAAAFNQTMTCSYERGSDNRCSPGEEAKPVFWARRCVLYKVNSRGARDLPGPDGGLSDSLLATIQRSFETWNEVGCSDFSMRFDGLTNNGADFDASGGIAGNENVIVWVDDWPYDRSAYALASVTLDLRTGRIQDVDIEMNEDIFEFTDTNDPNATIVDVRNTLTHEVGHLLGLDHSDVRDATMFFSAAEGELHKRDLHQDDINGICAIYATGTGQSMSCTQDAPRPGATGADDDLCATVGAAAALPSLWTLLAALLGWRTTRRRKRRLA
jgi:hypothetical protein